jgi:hypothetical protein
MYDLTVRAHGPIFDRRADAEAGRYATAAQDHVATWARNRVVGQLIQVIRKPTPYYWTQIRTDRAAGGTRVHDGGMVYGPWLEGTGSRNRTTRFKGYRSFRIVRQQTNQRAVSLATEILPPFLERMGG